MIIIYIYIAIMVSWFVAELIIPNGTADSLRDYDKD